MVCFVNALVDVVADTTERVRFRRQFVDGGFSDLFDRLSAAATNEYLLSQLDAFAFGLGASARACVRDQGGRERRGVWVKALFVGTKRPFRLFLCVTTLVIHNCCRRGGRGADSLRGNGSHRPGGCCQAPQGKVLPPLTFPSTRLLFYSQHDLSTSALPTLLCQGQSSDDSQLRCLCLDCPIAADTADPWAGGIARLDAAGQSCPAGGGVPRPARGGGGGGG